MFLSIIATISLFPQEPAQAGDSMTPTTIALQWMPQSQFAGYYMAKEKGFYRDAGLAVTLQHATPEHSSFTMLIDHDAQFATLFLADAIVQHEKTPELTLIAQFVQNSNLMLIARRSSGIRAPQDLHGRQVSFWQNAFSVTFNLFFKQHGVTPVTIPQYHTINLFLEQGIDVCAAMHYNEYHRAYQAGIDYDELTIFHMRDYNLNFPEDGLYALKPLDDPQTKIALAIREATLKGWQYAQDNPEETINIVQRYSRNAAIPSNKPHSRWMLQTILPSILATNHITGQLTPEAFAASVNTLQQEGLLRYPPQYQDFYPTPFRTRRQGQP